MRLSLIILTILSTLSIVHSQTQVACGPARTGCGPASVASIGGATTTTVTTTTGGTSTTAPAGLVVPGALAADANCPTTLSTPTGNNGTGWSGYVLMPQTCATGANAAGYDVTGMAVYIASAAAGTHLKCSVYTIPGAHLAAGCDSVEVTLALNPNAYIPMATTGACHLATVTRYTIACATDSGNLSWSTATGGNTLYTGSVAYATLWPSSLAGGTSSAGIISAYLTVNPS